MSAVPTIIKHMFDPLSSVPGSPVDPGTVAGWLERLATTPAERDPVEQLDLITGLERLKSAAAAAQARLTSAFASTQDTGEDCGAQETGTDRSTVAQLALARRESPHRGQQHLGLATVLCTEMPHTLTALTRGDITEWQATLIVRETAVLTRADRARVDLELTGQLAGLGDRGIAAATRRIADRLDPAAALRRHRRGREHRRVTIRPAPDAMARLSGVLPLAEGVAAYAALHAHATTARTAGDPRTLGQIMADELYRRLTGRTTESSPGQPSSPRVEIGLVMTERTLLRGGTDPAQLTGPGGQAFGTVPATVARALVREADRAWLRRLYAAPATGELVATDSRRRTFTGTLRQLLVWRDQTCRTPWCEAPVRHLDHIHPAGRHGPTRAENGQGLCEACNYAKQAPGWHADVIHPAGHLIEITTPTGHTYTSRPPPAPGHEPHTDQEHLRRTAQDWTDDLGA